MHVRQINSAQRPRIKIADCVLRGAPSTIPPFPKLTHPTLTGMLNNRHQFRSGFSRWLGVLLIAFILYGTTVEAAHRHGRVLSNKSDATSVTHSETPGNLKSSQSGCGDCLICQLHQHVSTTLIALRLNDPPARVLQTTTAVVTPHFLSRVTTP